MKKVLLIEDSKDIRNNIAEILQFAGYEVLTAENGKTGVQMAIEHKPDIVVCDIMMPVLDGYGVINIVQKNPETQHTPFIFLTAKTERDEIRKGMALGADDYITKPFEEVDLLEAIERRLKKADLLKQKYEVGITGYNQLVSRVSNGNELKEMVNRHNEMQFRRKDMIYYESNHPINIYYLVKGVVKAYKTNDDGKELSVGLYGPGDFFGYTAVLNNTTYKETAQAIEDCTLVVIPRSEFEGLLMSNIDTLRKFAEILTGSIVQKEQRLLNLAYDSVRKKIATILIELYYKKTADSNVPCTIDISRDNLASLTGMTKESTIRVLSDFNAEKLVSIHNSIITINSLTRLQNMLN
jgi:CheY-like chemotaxis protein